MASLVRIDVHKARLVVAIDDERPFGVARTPAGLARLAVTLTARQPERVVLEPSGGYERLVIERLQAAGLPVARVHARQVRSFARGQGIAAKSDPVDARVLVAFGRAMAPRLVTAPRPEQRQITDLGAVRRTLIADRVAKQHQQAEQPGAIQAIYAGIIAFLADQIAILDARIQALVDASPTWARRRAILRSCPGIGATTAALLLAELPELGTGSGKQIAALVGVAPITQHSGAARGHAQIQGGRRHVRAALWMPTLVAMRCNPVIAAFRARLDTHHKPHKVRTIACLRKLLVMLNAMLLHDTPWHPGPQTA